MPFITARVISVIRDDVIAALAFAGSDQSVLCTALVQLQGQIIGDDIANHRFEWEQTAGTPVTLINPNTLTPSFVNPLVSDLEFTLYLDRNTPYEDSDAVFISRAPQSSMTAAIGGGTASSTNRPGTATAASNISGTNDELINGNAHVTGWVFNEPPAPRYSLIYSAADLKFMRENLNGQYWLMNDIDLGIYDNWEPIGTSRKPFSGELQGNGHKIQNLNITTPFYVSNDGQDPATLLAHFEDTDGVTTTTSDDENAFTLDFAGTSEIDTADSYFGGASARIDGNNDFVTPANQDGITLAETVSPLTSPAFDFGTGDFTMECFFKLNGLPSAGTGDAMALIGKAFRGISGGYDWWWQLDKDDAGFTFQRSPTGNIVSAQSAVSVSSTFSTGIWYHAAAVREGDDMNLYFQGSRVGNNVGFFTANPDIWNNDSPSGGHNKVTIGYIGGLGSSNAARKRAFDGFIDEVNIVKYAKYSGTTYTIPGSPFTTSLFKNAGLFADIGNGAIIEKLGVTNATIGGVSSAAYKGILAGTAGGTSGGDNGTVTIRDVYVSGAIDAAGDKAGGLIGHTGTNASSIYENTYADVTITGGGTDTGGWAGTFDATPTYIENYSNTTKTAAVVGTGSPAGTEVSGLTTAQLTAEANYTGWDFVSTWEIDEGVSPTTLQQFTGGRVDQTGKCDDNWMITWDTPAMPTSISAPRYVFRGTIVEEWNGSGWTYPRWIPKERHGAWMTPATQHRITSVWDQLMTSSIGRLVSFPVKSIRVINNEKFTSKETSYNYGPYGASAITTSIGGTKTGSKNFNISISNPSKISLAQADNNTMGIGGAAAASTGFSILRLGGASKAFEDTAASYGIGGSETGNTNLNITRLSGASIGGG